MRGISPVSHSKFHRNRGEIDEHARVCVQKILQNLATATGEVPLIPPSPFVRISKFRHLQDPQLGIQRPGDRHMTCIAIERVNRIKIDPEKVCWHDS